MVNKITTPPTTSELIGKVNEIVDDKQDTIADLSTIRSGAALGATSVQPSELATVATTGSYTDLLNKPTIPTVNNATLTITQGGVSKGTFTANASSDVTIALDAGGGSYTAGSGIDITSNTISVTAPTLTNKNTGNTYGIAISDIITGSTTSAYSTVIGGRLNITGGSNVAIGDNTKVDGGSIAIGAYASATGTTGLNRLCIAIGTSATVTANNGIQLGYGTNSEANSFYVGTSTSNNWKILGNDGLIPYARIPFDDVTQNASTTAKETIIGWCMPDYDSGYSVASTTREYCYWVQAPTDGIVLIDDGYNQDWIIRISKTGSVNGTGESTGPESALPADQITISHHIDAFNGTGTGSAFAFVPKNYYFSLSGHPGNTGKFFPLKGEVNA